ncbi:MAG: hypothetical protein ACK5ZY_05080 [Cyclobacteriaceae bacterium]
METKTKNELITGGWANFLALMQIISFVWLVFFLLPFVIYSSFKSYSIHQRIMNDIDVMNKNADRMIIDGKRLLHKMDSVEKSRGGGN